MNAKEPATTASPAARRNGISNEMVGILAMGVAMIGVSTASWATLYNEIGALRADVREDIGHVRADIGRLEDRMRVVETGLVVVEGLLTAVEGRLTAVEGRLTDVEGRLTDVEGRLAAVEVHIGSMAVAEAGPGSVKW